MNSKLLFAVPLACALGTIPPAVAQSKSPTSSEAKPAAAATTTSPAADAKPIEDLRMAAQRMRDAIHDMLNAPAGQKRGELITAADRALAEVESAMANLPPELLTAQVTESAYKKTTDRLQHATMNLEEAAQALSKDPNSQRRNETIAKIKTALQETHRLMHEIPRGPTQG